MSPELWSRIIRETREYLKVSVEKLAENIGVSSKTIYAWLNSTRTPPVKRLGNIQRQLLSLGVPRGIVYATGDTKKTSRKAEEPGTLYQKGIQRRKQPELREVFQLIERMLACQNAKMAAELKTSLVKLLRVEVNEAGKKK